MGVRNEVHASSMEVLAGQEPILVRLVKKTLLRLLLLLLLLLNLVLLEGQQLLLLLLLSCQQLLQRYQLLLLLCEGNQLLGVAHSQGAAQETCHGRLLGAGGQVGGAYAWAAQTPESCLDLLHLSLLFVFLCVRKLDHNRGGAPLHREAVVHRLDGDHRDLSTCKSHKCTASADSLVIPQNGDLLNRTKFVKHLPDVLFAHFLANHPDEQLPLVSILSVGRFHLKRVMHPW